MSTPADRNTQHKAEQEAEPPQRRREDFAAKMFQLAVTNMREEFARPERRKDDPR